MGLELQRKKFYLDHCGTTPLASEVIDFLRSSEAHSKFGNPSATHHSVGNDAAEFLESSRTKIALELNADPRKVYFTSSATEANNLVILGFWMRFRDRGCRVLYSAIEHKSCLDSASKLNELENGFSLEIPVGKYGEVDLSFLEASLVDNPNRLPTLVVVMHTNNEIPVRQPIEDIAQLCKKHKAFFHCDAVQGIVREKISYNDGLYGSLVCSSHKMYGPKGCGILVLGDSSLAPLVSPLLVGGDQEGGVRPGTQNLLAISAAAIAICTHGNTRSALVDHMWESSQIFASTLKTALKNFHLTVPLRKECAGIVNFYLDGLDSATLLNNLPQVCINKGASCLGGGGEKFSHVPKALGLPTEIQANVVRASFGWGNTLLDAKDAADEIVSFVNSQKK